MQEYELIKKNLEEKIPNCTIVHTHIYAMNNKFKIHSPRQGTKIKKSNQRERAWQTVVFLPSEKIRAAHGES